MSNKKINNIIYSPITIPTTFNRLGENIRLLKTSIESHSSHISDQPSNDK